MKRTGVAGVALALAMAGTGTAAEKRNSVASDVDDALVGAPARDVWRGWLWIPISKAIDENGSVVPGRLPDHLVRQLSLPKVSPVFAPTSEMYDDAVDAIHRGHDCPFFSIVFEDRVDPRPNQRLSELVTSADRILEGVVVGEHGGLLIGEVGELLEVAVDGTLKGDRLDRVLLFYPYLKKMVGNAAVCRQDPTFGAAPRTGDRVVFFQLFRPANERGDLFKPQRTEVIFAGVGGELRSPAKNLLPPGMKTFDDLKAAISDLIDAR